MGSHTQPLELLESDRGGWKISEWFHVTRIQIGLREEGHPFDWMSNQLVICGMKQLSVRISNIAAFVS